MHIHQETQHHPYSPAQLYDLVADVEKYPEFLPWCRAARVIERHKDFFIAQLVISFKGVTEQYTSKVFTTPPDGKIGEIKVELVNGPFKTLDNHWVFKPESGGTQIDFEVRFAFQSAILDKLIGLFFKRASERMVSAFSERATELYGNA